MNYLQYFKDLEMRRAGVLHCSDLKASAVCAGWEDTTALPNAGEQNPWDPFTSTSCTMCPELPRCFKCSHSPSNHGILPLCCNHPTPLFQPSHHVQVLGVTWATGSGPQQGCFTSLALLTPWLLPVLALLSFRLNHPARRKLAHARSGTRMHHRNMWALLAFTQRIIRQIAPGFQGVKTKSGSSAWGASNATLMELIHKAKDKTKKNMPCL